MDKVKLKPIAEVTVTESSESSSQNSSDFHLKEKDLEIDYSLLTSSNMNLIEDELKKEITSLKNKQNAIRVELQLIHPKLKV
jgi:DNA-directed RNA polymerase